MHYMFGLEWGDYNGLWLAALCTIRTKQPNLTLATKIIELEFHLFSSHIPNLKKKMFPCQIMCLELYAVDCCFIWSMLRCVAA